MPTRMSRLAAKTKPRMPWIRYRPQLKTLSKILEEKLAIETWMESR